ncbi:hypothetical protein MATL_G00161430 [Megalops atlanticus]|uniref:Ig-like domain-containing protein n=1 Tax=Megalops atlanticus TaxID=7932 RepID=A0A9D3PRE2_MEGAT|nr:hypothetical protein MATL_G00161430 [Megalops atlanticus]
MLAAVFLCILFHLFHRVLSDPVVLQSETSLLPKAGATVTLQCSMSGSMSSYTMYWYRQPHTGGALEFLKKEHDTSDEKDRFSVSLDTSENKFSLRVSDLTSQDSATYYCVASHSAARCTGICTRSMVVFKRRSKIQRKAINLFTPNSLILDDMGLFWVFATLLFSTRSSDGVSVTQKPPVLFTKAGAESETLHCEHDDDSFYRMFWYRQDSDRGMRLMAYSLGQNTVNIEPPFSESKYTMTRTEVKTSSLQIRNIEAVDSAVYFCATSIAH